MKPWLFDLVPALSYACDSPAEFRGPRIDCDPLVPEFCGYPFPSNV